ncbi:fungal protein [Schizosaccharomyces japonicus yFS275]|uniref:Fungal protein n=1 Tax=Schizosaccharomyces japonicus (strain yFS275 / FY16936) TaxID=402676 RepID=B6K4G2_SCHJY|nr:fungal protein [Schizosaccharomyces japonicus yFS275]EEB08369.1 fungal protein [Schizosaccharomyces japonicus yFS275]
MKLLFRRRSVRRLLQLTLALTAFWLVTNRVQQASSPKQLFPPPTAWSGAAPSESEDVVGLPRSVRRLKASTDAFLNELHHDDVQNTVLFVSYGIDADTHSLFELACRMASTQAILVNFAIIGEHDVASLFLFEANRETVDACPVQFVLKPSWYGDGRGISARLRNLRDDVAVRTTRILLEAEVQNAIMESVPRVIVTSQYASPATVEALKRFLDKQYFAHIPIDTRNVHDSLWLAELDLHALAEYRIPRFEVVLFVEMGAYKLLDRMLRMLRSTLHSPSNDLPRLFMFIRCDERLPHLTNLYAGNAWPRDRLSVRWYTQNSTPMLVEAWIPPDPYTYAIVIDLLATDAGSGDEQEMQMLSPVWMAWLRYAVLHTFYREHSRPYKANVLAILPTMATPINDMPFVLTQEFNSRIALFAPDAFYRLQQYVMLRLSQPDFIDRLQEQGQQLGVPAVTPSQFPAGSVFNEARPFILELERLLGFVSLQPALLDDDTDNNWRDRSGSLEENRENELSAHVVASEWQYLRRNMRRLPALQLEKAEDAPLIVPVNGQHSWTWSESQNRSAELFKSISSCFQEGQLSEFPIESIFCGVVASQ